VPPVVQVEEPLFQRPVACGEPPRGIVPVPQDHVINVTARPAPDNPCGMVDESFLRARVGGRGPTGRDPVGGHGPPTKILDEPVPRVVAVDIAVGVRVVVPADALIQVVDPRLKVRSGL
jgi:hypothetical protein